MEDLVQARLGFQICFSSRIQLAADRLFNGYPTTYLTTFHKRARRFVKNEQGHYHYACNRPSKFPDEGGPYYIHYIPKCSYAWSFLDYVTTVTSEFSNSDKIMYHVNNALGREWLQPFILNLSENERI